MSFDPETAAIRFGTGLSARIAPPKDVRTMLAGLKTPDAMAARYPIPLFKTLQPELADIRALNREKRRKKGTPAAKIAKKKIRGYRKKARQNQAIWMRSTVLRGMNTPDGLRERLTWFWADHFTVRGKSGVLRRAVAPYVEEAIRPHIAGKFGDMLRAVVLHPMMLIYLDQYNSVGPHSPVARRKKNRGLNENLGRELLELHTLGVGGSYDQHDVRQLANLLTGLSYAPDKGFVFRRGYAEPGAKKVLGRVYGGKKPNLQDILTFLDTVAVHPDTARHLARKLVVHFVSDVPDPALVEHVAAAYRASKGDLTASYAALLDHPAAWAKPDKKAKRPFDFIVSALRALPVSDTRMDALKARDVLFYLGAPMAMMGQTWEAPVGPDGWAEDASAWITPQGVAARIQWAMAVPERLRPDLPDPRQFVKTALGTRTSAALRFAAGAAETRAEGVGIILSAPEFQKH